MTDFHPIQKASYYNWHESGVETKEVTFYLSGLLASAVKYTLRVGRKGSLVEDLTKAAWCFKDEALRLARDGGPFDISDKWVEPARRVVLWKPLTRYRTRPEKLLEDVLSELLSTTVGENLRQFSDPTGAVMRCSTIVQAEITEYETTRETSQ